MVDPADPQAIKGGKDIKPMDEVRVRLLDGQRIEGRFLGRDATTLTMETEEAASYLDNPDFNYGGDAEDGRLVIPLLEVVSLEHYGINIEWAAVIVLGAVAITAGAIYAKSINDSMGAWGSN